MFLARVGATDPASVLLTKEDVATVGYWLLELADGRGCPALSIEFDAAGNILNADGRHRALAAKLAGISRVPVTILRFAGN